MGKGIYRKSIWDFVRGAMVPIIFTAVMMGMIVSGLRQTEESSRAENLRILEDSIRRAVVVAYAIEGRYPQSIEYIEKRFGIHIDWTRYHVHYDVFACNIFPDVTVIELAR